MRPCGAHIYIQLTLWCPKKTLWCPFWAPQGFSNLMQYICWKLHETSRSEILPGHLKVTFYIFINTLVQTVSNESALL